VGVRANTEPITPAVPEEVRREDRGGSGAAEGEKPHHVSSSAARVIWEEPEVMPPVIHEDAVIGGGHHDPHMVPSGDYRYPEIDVDYNPDTGVWSINSITVHSLIRLDEPGEGAYPVVGANVLNDRDLGLRTPRDNPAGKGYWRKVVENLKLYGPDVLFSNLQWWVRGSTLRHEKAHHELYREWFDRKWGEFRTELEHALRERLENNEVQPVTKENIETAAYFSLKFILELAERDRPDTESGAKTITAKACWRPKAEEVKREATGLGWDGKE
jgi:hypothetical protein